MSIFDYDWNRNKKIDYNDTLLDLALINYCENETDEKNANIYVLEYDFED